MTQAPSKQPAPALNPDSAKSGSAKPPAGCPVMVHLKGVNKTYANGTFSLLNINLNMRRGDFLFITGASGSGKSTLMKLIYGEERPDQGQVIVDNLNVGQLRGNRLALLRRRLGVVFQDYKLIPRRTVAENVAFVLRAQGVPRQEIQRRLLPALKLVGLQTKADCFPDQLSGGEQQRTSIARAIVGTPSLLLADEPTGNLDPENALQVLNILKTLNSLGITVIVTTHDVNLIQISKLPVSRLCNGRLQAPQQREED